MAFHNFFNIGLYMYTFFCFTLHSSQNIIICCTFWYFFGFKHNSSSNHYYSRNAGWHHLKPFPIYHSQQVFSPHYIPKLHSIIVWHPSVPPHCSSTLRSRPGLYSLVRELNRDARSEESVQNQKKISSKENLDIFALQQILKTLSYDFPLSRIIFNILICAPHHVHIDGEVSFMMKVMFTM